MHTLRTKNFEHIGQEVLDKIINIYGEIRKDGHIRGERIVGYLNTAHQLLEINEGLISMNFNLPKFPETIAYCIREALTEPLEIVGPRNNPQLGEYIPKVLMEKKSYLRDAKQPGFRHKIYLGKIFNAIDELESANEKVELGNMIRLEKLFEMKNFALKKPWDSIIKDYGQLLKKAQYAVHNSTSKEEVEKMWIKCCCIHRKIYLS